jgi:hypothetical protein
MGVSLDALVVAGSRAERESLRRGMAGLAVRGLVEREWMSRFWPKRRPHVPDSSIPPGTPCVRLPLKAEQTATETAERARGRRLTPGGVRCL